MKKVIFSHGKESGPFGKKINLMMEVAISFDYEVASIDYRNIMDVNQRVSLLKDYLSKGHSKNTILVGSSMGGYVSMVASMEYMIKGLFLLCPALYKEDYPIQEYQSLTKNITIIHGWQDEVIPFENSIQFGEKHQANVLLTQDNHRLSNSYVLIKEQFRLFLLNSI